MKHVCRWILGLALGAAAIGAPATVAADWALAQAGSVVPSDLKPLLATPASEMRLVVTRYNADRQTLNLNYAGPGGFNMARGGRRGQGRGAPGGGGAAAAQGPVPVSPPRLSRLKRFDLDWQTALSKLNTAKFSPLATTDLASLQTVIVTNLMQIEAENLTLAQIAPAIPFAPKLVALIEGRIRVDDINSEHAARALTEVQSPAQ